MDRGAQSVPPSFSVSFFSFVLSLEDMRSRKDLAEDWLGDQDGILVFVRRARLFSTIAHYVLGDLFLTRNQSGLFSVMIIVFIIGGNDKMRCNPIAEHALWVAQMSDDLIGMLDGTHEGTPPASAAATTPSFVPYRPNVSLWINVIWTTSLTFSLASTFFGIIVRRWAARYLFNNLHRIDTRIPRHIRLKAGEDVDTSRPVALDTLIRLFLPLSVALFFLGLAIFMLHIGISPALVFVSSLVPAWLLYVFLISSHVRSLLTSLG